MIIRLQKESMSIEHPLFTRNQIQPMLDKPKRKGDVAFFRPTIGNDPVGC